MKSSNKDLKTRLEAETQDDDLVRLKDKVVGMVKRSRSVMSKKYSTWDKHNDVYRGIRTPDEDDLKAAENDEPEKLVVPMAFAQVNTFASFCFLLFKQNGRLFEMLSSGAEDGNLKDVGERLLERDLRWNYFDSQLFQVLLDISRFNIGIKKTSWHKKTQWVQVTKPAVPVLTDGGFDLPEAAPTTEWVEATSYHGNLIQAVSPYNFFPDPNYPVSEWRKGEFAADESECHIGALKKREKAGEVFGIDKVKPMDKKAFEGRGKTYLEGVERYVGKNNPDEDSHMVILTECQLEIVPKKYGLSDVEHPILYVVEVANDERIIRAEPMGYLHGEFGYDVGQFAPDQHQLVGDCLSDTISALQDVVSFFFNSRLMSVRKSLDNNLVIDPVHVDMASVESRSPWILMKKGSPRLGLDKFIKQLGFVDTTVRHLDDVDTVMRLMMAVTGVNENAMGQFSGGRRSATEARAVNAGAASRMKMVATMIWSDMLAPMGNKMLSNLRQGIDEESFVKAVGQNHADKYPIFHPEDPLALVGCNDLFTFDSTLQSEKGFIAQSLQELVSAITSNPIVMQTLPLNVGALIEEILTLRGITDLDRFKYANPTIGGGPVIPGSDLGGPQAGPAAVPGLPTNPGLPALPQG